MVICNELMARITDRFGRIAPRRAAGAYVRGLLADIDRKNCWNLAERAGLTGPQALQRVLRTARWDADGVRDDVRDFIVDRLGPDGVLIVDETGFVKKGVGSAGVQRQYSGTAGRIENCQIGVFCAYATPRGRALLDRRLYLRSTPRWPTRAAAVAPAFRTRRLSPPSPPWPSRCSWPRSRHRCW